MAKRFKLAKTDMKGIKKFFYDEIKFYCENQITLAEYVLKTEYEAKIREAVDQAVAKAAVFRIKGIKVDRRADDMVITIPGFFKRKKK